MPTIFESERHIIPAPFGCAHRMLDLHGEKYWDELTNVTPCNRVFRVVDHADAFMARTGISTREQAIRVMNYLLRLGAAQDEPACKGGRRVWEWMGPNEYND